MLQIIRMDKEPVRLQQHFALRGDYRFGLLNNSFSEIMLDFVQHQATEVGLLEVTSLPRAVKLLPNQGVQGRACMDLTIDPDCRYNSGTKGTTIILSTIIKVFNLKKDQPPNNGQGEPYEGRFEERPTEILDLAMPIELTKASGPCSRLKLNFELYERPNSHIVYEMEQREKLKPIDFTTFAPARADHN